MVPIPGDKKNLLSVSAIARVFFPAVLSAREEHPLIFLFLSSNSVRESAGLT
jgi:hypothetical protein